MLFLQLKMMLCAREYSEARNAPSMIDSNIAVYLELLDTIVLICGRTEKKASHLITPSKFLDR